MSTEFQPYWVLFASHACGLIVRKVHGPEAEGSIWMRCEEIARSRIATLKQPSKNTFYRMPAELVESLPRFDTQDAALEALYAFQHGPQTTGLLMNYGFALASRLDLECAVRDAGAAYIATLKEGLHD